MVRLTKWNEAAGKWEYNFCEIAPTYKAMWDVSAQKLAVFEEFFPNEEDFLDYFSKNCQNCAKCRVCPHAPKWGEPVRYGCALFLGGTE